jgi:hypothetical protein
MSQDARIAKVSYTHAACVDLILARPEISQKELAAHFGYTQPWMCRIIGSDAFQEYLAGRRKELIDPVVVQKMEDRIKGVMVQAMDVVQEKLTLNPTADFALKAMEISSRALGYGVRDSGASVQVNQYLVHTPPKSADSKEWLSAHAPAALTAPAPVIDVEATA